MERVYCVTVENGRKLAEYLYLVDSVAEAVKRVEEEAVGEIMSVQSCEVLTPVEMLQHLLTQAYCPCEKDIQRTLKVYGGGDDQEIE